MRKQRCVHISNCAGLRRVYWMEKRRGVHMCCAQGFTLHARSCAGVEVSLAPFAPLLSAEHVARQEPSRTRRIFNRGLSSFILNFWALTIDSYGVDNSIPFRDQSMNCNCVLHGLDHRLLTLDNQLVREFPSIVCTFVVAGHNRRRHYARRFKETDQR